MELCHARLDIFLLLFVFGSRDQLSWREREGCFDEFLGWSFLREAKLVEPLQFIKLLILIQALGGPIIKYLLVPALFESLGVSDNSVKDMSLGLGVDVYLDLSQFKILVLLEALES